MDKIMVAFEPKLLHAVPEKCCASKANVTLLQRSIAYWLSKIAQSYAFYSPTRKKSSQLFTLFFSLLTVRRKIVYQETSAQIKRFMTGAYMVTNRLSMIPL